jgi:hypothetical protein
LRAHVHEPTAKQIVDARTSARLEYQARFRMRSGRARAAMSADKLKAASAKLAELRAER